MSWKIDELEYTPPMPGFQPKLCFRTWKAANGVLQHRYTNIFETCVKTTIWEFDRSWKVIVEAEEKR